jgi:hypothetical protein
MSRSSFEQIKNFLNWRSIRFRTRKSWRQLYGIHWDFTWSRLFQRAGFLMPNSIVTISSRDESGSAQRVGRDTSFFMQTIHARTRPNSVALFVPRIDGGLPHIRPTRPISRHQTSSSSVMFSIAGKESYLPQVRNYLREFVGCWGDPARDLSTRPGPLDRETGMGFSE